MKRNRSNEIYKNFIAKAKTQVKAHMETQKHKTVENKTQFKP